MASKDHQPYEDRPRRRGKSRSRRARRRQRTKPAESPSAADDYALLADPATIAGMGRGRPATHAPSAATATSEPPEPALTESSYRGDPPGIEPADETGWPGAARESGESSPVAADGDASPRRGLLDAASARRLAAEARSRERASREALAATQRLIEQAGSGDTQPVVPKPTESAWQRHPLVSAQAGVEPSPQPARPSGPQRSPLLEANRKAIDEPVALELRRALAAVRAENRELQSTLSIARDTTRGHKQIIADLRRELDRRAQRETTPEAKTSAAESVPSHTAPASTTRSTLELALERADREVHQLRERLTRLERAADEREAERLHLQRTHDELAALLSARNAQIDTLRDRFEAQDRALDGARREYELERARHSKSLEILARLRSALAGDAIDTGSVARVSGEELADADLPSAAPADMAPVDVAPVEKPIPIPGIEFATAPTALPDDTTAARDLSLVVPVLRVDAPVAPATSEPARSAAPPKAPALPPYGAVFDAWQDDQIRRHFGPMGIDTFVDLLRAPLSRRMQSASSEQHIVLLGRGAWRFAARLTEGLVENGTSAFMIHVGDPEGAYASGQSSIPLDSPVRDYLCPFDLPSDPISLDAALDALNPSAIVSRDFLSHESQVAPWLACLERRVLRGACLLFSERTGVALSDPPSEMTSIGERIWELMPDRYTRIADSHERIASWLEGFSACATPSPNQLISEIRERFQVEAISQFGYLAEPFLCSAISPNFDPHAPRDLRFLRQVADLDDRKIESGVAPALHFIGLVDPLCESETRD